jgi:hypothetical protein
MSQHKTYPVYLVEYTCLVGWRIRGISNSKHNQLGVVKIGRLNFLRLPVHVPSQKPGKFCSPRKLLGV